VSCTIEAKMSSGGRPIGSKNQRGHSAGGKRKIAGRPSREQQEQDQNEAAERVRRMQDQRQSSSVFSTSRMDMTSMGFLSLFGRKELCVRKIFTKR
jgi:hypothetical protein